MNKDPKNPVNSKKDSYYYNGLRSEMATFLPAEYSKVLEIGCGRGGFVKNLNVRSEVWGVEVDEESAKEASKRMDRVIVGSWSDVCDLLPNESFDLIICNDVIEHMPNHDQFFESIKNKMVHGGRLMGSVPNIRHIRALYELVVRKDWPYRECGVFDRTHLRYFTKRSLVRCLSNHGFIIEAFEGINSTSYTLHRIFIKCLVVLTLGYYSDVQYLQYGFRIRKIK